MASKSILPRGFKAEAERLSESYRAHLKLSKFDPLDAFKLANFLGIPIVSFYDFVDEQIASKLENTFDAMWMPNADGDKIIIHNTKQSAFRQQSNLMHELAHIIRKHEIPDEIKNLVVPLNLHYYNELHEQEAKYLGGCLQITRAGLFWALKRKFTYEQISDYFGASVDMVRYRVNSTGVGKQLAYMK
ncbi:MAG TPA: ImmA/IrrE family metallo-endopeptidase [Cytophagales bacterium]|nr:ImmA/IrrE family metallo-endopeptidase [Cytophagales bacterium]